MILTLGDSFTYGEELTYPLVDAWPALLGQMFNQPAVNRAKPGGSNDMMFRLAVTLTAKEQFDLVIVAWSDPSRFETKVNNDIICVNSNRTTPAWIKQYYQEGYSDELAHVRWFTSMLALQHYFKSINQKYLFCTVGEVVKFNEYYQFFSDVLDKLDKTYMTSWPIEGFLSWQGDCPKGPRGHPLELGHERIANKLAEYIRELNLL